jgi:hypothetical protein
MDMSGIFTDLRSEELERDVSREARVAGTIHFPDATGPQK